MFGYPLRLSQRPAPPSHEELQGSWERLTGKEGRREKDGDLEGGEWRGGDKSRAELAEGDEENFQMQMVELRDKRWGLGEIGTDFHSGLSPKQMSTRTSSRFSSVGPEILPVRLSLQATGASWSEAGPAEARANALDGPEEEPFLAHFPYTYPLHPPSPPNSIKSQQRCFPEGLHHSRHLPLPTARLHGSREPFSGTVCQGPVPWDLRKGSHLNTHQRKPKRCSTLKDGGAGGGDLKGGAVWTPTAWLPQDTGFTWAPVSKTWNKPSSPTGAISPFQPHEAKRLTFLSRWILCL